jgi:hypothetical protein
MNLARLGSVSVHWDVSVHLNEYVYITNRVAFLAGKNGQSMELCGGLLPCLQDFIFICFFLYWFYSISSLTIRSSVSTVTRRRAGLPGFDFLRGQVIFLFAIMSMALGPTQSPVQLTPWTLSRGYSGRGVKLTTHVHLVSRLRVVGVIPPLPHTFSWRVA